MEILGQSRLGVEEREDPKREGLWLDPCGKKSSI